MAIYVDQNVILTSWDLLILKITSIIERGSEDIGFIKCDCLTCDDRKTEGMKDETNGLDKTKFNFLKIKFKKRSMF